MATVKFSDQLKDDVSINAERLFEARLKEVNKPVSEPIARQMWIDFFDKYAMAFSTLPDEFFHLNEEIAVRSSNYSIPSTNITVPRIPNPIRSVNCERFSFDAARWSKILLVRDHSDNQAYQDEAKRINEELDVIRAERNTFVEGVKKLVNSYSTLAPALKQWPPLWDLLPQKTQERHKLVIKRTKNDKAPEQLSDVDFDSMTSKVVTSKLLG